MWRPEAASTYVGHHRKSVLELLPVRDLDTLHTAIGFGPPYSIVATEHQLAAWKRAAGPSFFPSDGGRWDLTGVRGRLMAEIQSAGAKSPSYTTASARLLKTSRLLVDGAGIGVMLLGG